MDALNMSVEYSCGIEFYPLLDILFCHERDNWTRIMLKGYSSCTTSKTIRAIEQNLNSDQFFRVHRSYLVNLLYVRKIIGSYEHLELKDGHVIPVSRRRRALLRKYVNNIQ